MTSWGDRCPPDVVCFVCNFPDVALPESPSDVHGRADDVETAEPPFFSRVDVAGVNKMLGHKHWFFGIRGTRECRCDTP